MHKRKLYTDYHQTNSSPQMNFDDSNFINLKEEGAKLLEKTLTCTLAKHFVHCWEELKTLSHPPRLHAVDPIDMIKRRQDAGYTLDAIEKNRSISGERKQLPHQYRQPYFEEQSEGLCLQNPKIALSRANLLNEIVNKLNYPKSETSHEDVDMMRKIHKLQTMINDINEGEETKDESPELIEMISQEIKSIRDEIHSLKLTNEEFIRKEVVTNHTQSNSHIFSPQTFHPQPIKLLKKHQNQTNSQINVPLQNSINFAPIRAQSLMIEEKKIIPQPLMKKPPSEHKISVFNKQKFTKVREDNRYRKLVQIPAISTVKEIKAVEYEKPSNFPQIQRYEPRFSYGEISSEGSEICCGEHGNCLSDNFW